MEVQTEWGMNPEESRRHDEVTLVAQSKFISYRRGMKHFNSVKAI